MTGRVATDGGHGSGTYSAEERAECRADAPRIMRRDNGVTLTAVNAYLLKGGF